MTTYAIGDVQGCYAELQLLLERIDYAPERDTLWFTGDLVNRGPQSLAVLRFVRDLGDRAVTVLGNHDLHLLAIAAQRLPRANYKDTLDEVLHAPDRTELLDWLRSRPVLHGDQQSGFSLLHAGLPPQWTMDGARACAAELEACLRGPAGDDFLARMYGDEPARWSPTLSGWDRLRFITNCFTRMRYCDTEGRLHLTPKGSPGTQPAGLHPWYALDARRSRDSRIVFGHWSTLRLSPQAMRRHKVYPLDTGCLWGGELTAMRLDDQRLFHVPSLQQVDASPSISKVRS